MIPKVSHHHEVRAGLRVDRRAPRLPGTIYGWGRPNDSRMGPERSIASDLLVSVRSVQRWRNG